MKHNSNKDEYLYARFTVIDWKMLNSSSDINTYEIYYNSYEMRVKSNIRILLLETNVTR